MNFTENLQDVVILDKLLSQRKEGLYCDVVFHAEDRQYAAHRNVLAACTPYFSSVFKSDHSAIQHIEVECRNHQVFESFLDYIYTGKIVIESSGLEELVRLSNRFHMAKLKIYCCEYLEAQLRTSNCFATKLQAQRGGLVSLAKTVDAFILANIIEIMQENEIMTFNEKKIQEFVSNRTLPVREELKIHIINRWVLCGLTERQFNYQHLLRLLSWDKISSAIVYRFLNEDSLYKSSERCLYVMLEMLNEKGALTAQFNPILTELASKYSPKNTTAPQLTVIDNAALDMLANQQTSAEADEPEVTNESCDQDIKQEVQASENNTASPSEKTPTKVICENLDSQKENLSEEEQDDDDDPEASDSNPDEIGKPDLCQPEAPALKPETRNSAAEAVKQKSSRKKQQRFSKRKGIPVKINQTPIKLRITRDRLKPEGKPYKKRGRPPKFTCKLKTPKDESESAKDASDSSKPHSRRARKNTTPSRCEHCNFATFREDGMLRHVKRAHKDKTVYSCSMCDFKSAWNREYYIHMKTHFSGPPFECDYTCGYVGDRIQQLLQHRMSHTDERPFGCEVCNMSFRSKNNLTMHEKCHTGIKSFQCEVCERWFATKGTLDQHRVTHSDLRPYLCDLCGFSTKYQSHLIAHKRIHTGDVFKCQYHNCQYSTPKRSQLACHMRSHMSIRSHVCATCGRAFVEKSHLVRHEKIHLDEKPFKCEICDYGSTRRDKLKGHMTKYHGDSPSPAKVASKTRRNRKQNFDPGSFPALSSEQANQEMQLLIQQSDNLRAQQQQLQHQQLQQLEQQQLEQEHHQHQQQQHHHHHILQQLDVTDHSNDVLQQTTTIYQYHPTITSAPSTTSAEPSTTVALLDNSGLVSAPTNLTDLTSQISEKDPGLDMTRAEDDAPVLTSLLDPRLPVVIGPPANQSAIMVIPQSPSSSVQYSQLNTTGAEPISPNTISSTTQPSQTSDFSTLQTFMNIF